MECKYYGYNGEEVPLCESNCKHTLHSAWACYGMDMSKVPAGAVRELVEAARIAELELPKDSLGGESLRKALAPFVKE